MVTDNTDRVGAAAGSADPRPDNRRTDTDLLPGGQLLLTQQAAEIIDDTTTAVEVADHLDLSSYARDDPYPEWHDSKPFEPMLRAILLAELDDASDAAVHRTLESDPETAADLGFDPDDVPDQSTLSRARRHRFAELSPDVAATFQYEGGAPFSEVAKSTLLTMVGRAVKQRCALLATLENERESLTAHRRGLEELLDEHGDVSTSD